MTSNSKTLKNKRPYFGNDSVLIGNGNLLGISSIGDTSITNDTEPYP